MPQPATNEAVAVTQGETMLALMKQGEQDAEMKVGTERRLEVQSKLRGYIVENSDLRMKVARMEKEHEEALKNKEEEYVLSKKTLEEEYRKRLDENQHFQRELDANRGALSDLRDVVASQKEELESKAGVIAEQNETLEAWKQKCASLERSNDDLKRRCDAFEEQKTADQRKRREIS